MSLEQKCKVCGTFQKLANKRCSCGYNLAAGRKQEQVPIYKRLPGGKRKKLAMNVEEARLREAKIKISIAEGLDPEDEDATVQDLAEWYLNQRTVKKLRSNRDVVRVINIRGTTKTLLEELGMPFWSMHRTAWTGTISTRPLRA